MTRRGSRSKPNARRSTRTPRPAAVPVHPTEEDRCAALLADVEEEWSRVWPFPTLTGLERLSDRIPAALVDAFPLLVESFPLVSYLEFFRLRDEIEAEHRNLDLGQNTAFDQAVTELAPLDISRAKLIALTQCLLPMYRLARTLSDRIEQVRPAVAKLTARLRVARNLVQAQPCVTPAACAELDAVLDYLAGIPTKAKLKAWRREIRLNRLGDDPWQLSVWTRVGDALVVYLERAWRDADATKFLPKPLGRTTFAYRAAHALLRARYPDVVPDDWRTLRRRIERAPAL